MSQFSSHEAVSLEKRIDIKQNTTQTLFSEIDSVYEIERCTKWILDNNFTNVRLCLQ